MRQANSFSRLNENYFVRVFINLPFICLDEACKWKNESEIEFSHIIPRNKRLCVKHKFHQIRGRWWGILHKMMNLVWIKGWFGSSSHFVYELYLYVSITCNPQYISDKKDILQHAIVGPWTKQALLLLCSFWCPDRKVSTN